MRARRNQNDNETPTCAFIPGWVLEHKQLSPGAKLAYATYGTVYDASNTQEKLSIAAIAKRMGTSVKEVESYVEELQEAKLVGRSTHRSFEELLERSMYGVTDDNAIFAQATA